MCLNPCMFYRSCFIVADNGLWEYDFRSQQGMEGFTILLQIMYIYRLCRFMHADIVIFSVGK